MDKKVCYCKNVTKGQIVEAVKNGADTVEKVQEATKAGAGCGRCKSAIEAIVEENK